MSSSIQRDDVCVCVSVCRYSCVNGALPPPPPPQGTQGFSLPAFWTSFCFKQENQISRSLLVLERLADTGIKRANGNGFRVSRRHIPPRGPKLFSTVTHTHTHTNTRRRNGRATFSELTQPHTGSATRIINHVTPAT